MNLIEKILTREFNPLSFLFEEVEKDNFDEWFSGSKIVDDDGEPLIVYRGDRENKTSFAETGDGTEYIKGNIFFSDQAYIGKFYTKYRTNSLIASDKLGISDGLYRVYLSIKNPLMLDGNDKSWSEIPIPEELRDEFNAEQMQIDDIGIEAKNLGYDGVVVKNVLDQAGYGTQYIAFNHEQIWIIK